MTKQEFIKEVNAIGFERALVELITQHRPIISRTYLQTLIKEAIDVNDVEVIDILVKALSSTADYFIYDETTLIKETPKPVYTPADIPDEFFDEDTEEAPVYTIEGIKQFIKDNNLEPLDLFEEGDLNIYVEDNWTRVVDTSDIVEYTTDKCSIDDLYTEDDIVTWVKNNIDIFDLVDVNYIW